MSVITLKAGDRLPAGTSVSAYPRSAWPGSPSLSPDPAAPGGAAAETQTVAADSTLTFTTLVDGTRYYAYALVGGQHRIVAFTMSSPGTLTEGSVSAAGSVGVASASLVARNPARSELTIVNDHATQIIYLQLATVEGTPPVAVVGQGIRLNAAGGSWTTNTYKGPVAAIASGAATLCTIAEV